jgi:hypothetical protein
MHDIGADPRQDLPETPNEPQGVEPAFVEDGRANTRRAHSGSEFPIVEQHDVRAHFGKSLQSANECMQLHLGAGP